MEAIVATVAAPVALLIGGVAGWLLRRPRTVLVDTSRAQPTKHEHAATTFNVKGWHCDCGQHRHVYVLPLPDTDKKRCVCGKSGVGKEWA